MLHVRHLIIVGILIGLGSSLWAKVPFRRDPFVPFSASQLEAVNDAPETFAITNVARLTGIVWDDKAPFALFDLGKKKATLTNGNSLDSWVVEQIYKDRVLLKRNSKAFIVRVGKEVAL